MSEEQAEHEERTLRAHVDLQSILDEIPVLVFAKDAENRLIHANRGAVDACGAGSLEALAGTDFARWLGADGVALDGLDARALSSGQPQLASIEHFELPGRGRSCFEMSRTPQRDAAGKVCGLVVMAREDRQQLASRQLQAQKLESIGKLAGGVAHDFNNLLTALFGLIAAAQRSVEADSLAHEYLALMQLAAEGGASFTRQLLAFARRQSIEPRVVDLNELVRQVASLLSRVLGAHITIDLALCPTALPVRVDTNQISQLLMNLALNARDAMPEAGRLTFRTSSVILSERELTALPGTSSGRHVRLVVQDTGEGLSDEARDHLFEPFYTSKAQGHGTGLGLATCYGIVKQHHGQISAESQFGQWTRFIIDLPEADAPVEALAPARTAGPARVGNETVLFAEDDDLVRHLSVAALSSSGYRLIEAAHGLEALKAAEEHAGPIHLLVTDIIMPRMGGVELARRFRQLRPDAAVLFMTGYAGDAVMPVAGGVNVLHKPFTNEALIARVREMLDALPAPDDGTAGLAGSGLVGSALGR